MSPAHRIKELERVLKLVDGRMAMLARNSGPGDAMYAALSVREWISKVIKTGYPDVGRLVPKHGSGP